MINKGKYNLLGMPISAVDYKAAVDMILNAAQGRQPLAVSAMAVHGVMTGALDPHHRYRLNRFDLLVPDGQPVRLGLNWLYDTGLVERVYGPTLMLEICRCATVAKQPIFLFGGTADLLRRLKRNLLRRFPDLPIAGTLASRFRTLTAPEQDEVILTIRASGAALTFVGLGCPRQEVWVFECFQKLSMPAIAVGAAFNFHAGLLPQAPPGLQKRSLEWLFRLSKEPRRLWRRYLLLNPAYMFLLLSQKLKPHLFDPPQMVRPLKEIRYG